MTGDEKARPEVERAQPDGAHDDVARARRRWPRRVLWLLLAAVIAIPLLFAVAYELGLINRYIESNVKASLARIGIRAEIGSFNTTLFPITSEMRDLKLYDATSGELLGKADSAVARLTIADLFALRLTRNITLDQLDLKQPEIWIRFDKDGRSNFANLKADITQSNVKFNYLAAGMSVTGGLVHYGDALHLISGEARAVTLTLKPEDRLIPEALRRYLFELNAAGSSFTYDGRKTDGIDLHATGSATHAGAVIDNLTLNSPLAQSQLHGAIDDWQKLTYRFELKSSVDLASALNLLSGKASLSGTAMLSGTIKGTGDKYEIAANVSAPHLSADNIQIQAISVDATGNGQGSSYDLSGNAIAEMLTAGEFRLDQIKLTAGVRGTGADFRWLGDLQAAAARVPGGTTIAGLFIRDAMAESKDEGIVASIKSASANRLVNADSTLQNLTANGIKLLIGDTTSSADIDSARAASARSGPGQATDLRARNISILTGADGRTAVHMDQVRAGSLTTNGAKVSDLNIAGVRLAVYQQRVTATSNDINVGTVTLDQSKSVPQGGRIDGVKLSHPVFVLEPQNRYRASADISLGGGAIGSINLGAARAQLIATNTEVKLANIEADLMDGHAVGNATIANRGNGTSTINGSFSKLEVSRILALVTGRIIPLTGATTGSVQLSFNGADLAGTATGAITASFETVAGAETSARTPLNGELSVKAQHGNFAIERATLSSTASRLTATGHFSMGDDSSDLQVSVASTDAFELQRLFTASGLFPDTNELLDQYAVSLGGNLAFTANLTGKIDDPILHGNGSIASIHVQELDLGAMSARIDLSQSELAISEGKLAELDGGAATFSVTAPRIGENNIEFSAQLDKVNANTIAALVPKSSQSIRSTLGQLHADLSGTIAATGLPDKMNGTANLRVGAGAFYLEQFDGAEAHATFAGSTVSLDQFVAHMKAGEVTASGSLDVKSYLFTLALASNSVALDKITSLSALGTFERPFPKLGGQADLTVTASGSLLDFSTYQIVVDGHAHALSVNSRPAGDMQLAGRTDAGIFKLDLTTTVLGKPQNVSATVDLRNDNLTTALAADLVDADLTSLLTLVLPPESVVVTGHATGSVRINGNLKYENAEGEDEYGFNALSGSVSFSALGFQVQDIPLNAEPPFNLDFTPNQLTFKQARLTGPGSNLVISGTKSLREGGHNGLEVNGSLNMRVLNGISPNYIFSGLTDLRLRIEGEHINPVMTGSANINNASFATFVRTERLTLTNIKGRALFNFNQIQLDTLNGNLGGGHVSLAGGILLSGFTPSAYRFTVRGDDVTVPFPEGFKTTGDSSLTISSSRVRGSLVTIIAGSVNVSRAEYRQNFDLADLINQRSEGVLTEGGNTDDTASLIGPTQLDLRVEGRDALQLHNNFGDLPGSVSLHVTGPLEDPIIAGRLSATSGTFLFNKYRYEITRAFVDLPPRRRADPVLNVQADTEIRGYTITVNITGPLSQPLAEVRSNPALPQADVVALITTGNLVSGDQNTSVLSQAGVGTAANLVADRLVNAPVRRATDKLFGLNRFEIEPVITGRGGTGANARLTVGRQVTKDLAITYATNVASADRNQVVAFEYRLSNRLSLVAQYEQGSINGLTTRNNNFSFEVRFKKRF